MAVQSCIACLGGYTSHSHPELWWSGHQDSYCSTGELMTITISKWNKSRKVLLVGTFPPSRVAGVTKMLALFLDQCPQPPVPVSHRRQSSTIWPNCVECVNKQYYDQNYSHFVLQSKLTLWTCNRVNNACCAQFDYEASCVPLSKINWNMNYVLFPMLIAKDV